MAHFAHNLAEINFPDRFYNYLPLSEKTQEKSNEQLENGNFIRPSVYGNPKWGSGTNLENKISSYETDWSMNIWKARSGEAENNPTYLLDSWHYTSKYQLGVTAQIWQQYSMQIRMTNLFR